MVLICMNIGLIKKMQKKNLQILIFLKISKKRGINLEVRIENDMSFASPLVNTGSHREMVIKF